MELLQLHYFQIVAQEENITRASEKLHISQPSLSKVIKRLEDELDFTLFDRNGKKIALNAGGKIFLQYVNTALGALQTGQNELKAYKEGTYPDIQLNAEAGVDCLIDLVSSFNHLYPQIHLFIRKENTQKNYYTRKYDLAIMMCPSESILPTASISLYEEELMVALPENHHLADKIYIDLEELKDEKFVLFQPTSVYRNSVERYCTQAGFSPNVVAEGHDWRMICGFVRANMGISIVPKHSWKSVFTGIKVIPIRNPHCARKIILTWFSDEKLTVSSKLFVQYATRYFALSTITVDENQESY